MKREAFLARVRQAAETGLRYRVPVAQVAPEAGYVGCQGDLCEKLAIEVQAVGGEPLVVDDWSAARASIDQILRQYQVRSALVWEHPALDRLELKTLLEQRGILVQGHAQLAPQSFDQLRCTILAADIGISSVDVAIAETGSLAVYARTGQERVISLVPPVHVAIVTQDQIVPDLFDLFTNLAEQRDRQLPSNVALISGPSKTGDIELELTTGVHGPGRWHVVIVRD